MCLNILAIPLTYLDFRLRQDYYANVLCVNQDQPIAMCGGRCFVDKQIARIQSEQQNAPDTSPTAPTLKIDMEVYVATPLLDFQATRNTPQCPLHSEPGPPVLSDYVATIFHPPRG